MAISEMTNGCPNCGVYGFAKGFKFKYCPYCLVKLVPGTKKHFREINQRKAKERFGFCVTEEIEELGGD